VRLQTISQLGYYSAAYTRARLVTSKALKSRTWRLIGVNKWYCIIWLSTGGANRRLDPLLQSVTLDL